MALLERNDTGAVAHLQMNAPERLNALSDEMLAALQAQFDSLKEDRAIRAVILSGAGKAFCAGHDLKQMTAGRQAEDGGRVYFRDLFERCAAMMLSIRDLPQPVIAQVHGIATAAGCQLVASCDLAVAASDTRFGVNGVNIGLFCSTPMVALTRNVPRKHAFEMLTTGRFIDAARSLGPASLVVLWIHNNGKPTRSRLAALFATWTPAPRVLELRGTGGFDREGRSPTPPGWEIVRLGHKRDGAGTRWLSHSEIHDGVIAAIDHPAPTHQIGHTDPTDAAGA